MASLKHLLAAGRSITGLRSSAAPYKVADQNFLSRLGPLALGGRRGFPGAVPASARPEAEVKAQERVAPGADRASVQTVVAESEAESKAARPVAAPEAGLTAARGTWSVRTLLNFTFFRTDRGNSRGHRLVQTELSLENVRVVRNDLMEADLEVVECASSVDGGLLRVSQSGRGAGGEVNGRMMSANWLSAAPANRTATATMV